MTFNADGSLANAVPTGSTSSTATGTISITIPWSSTSGLTAQPLSVNMGTVGSTDGVTQYDTTSTLTSANVDGAVYGSVSGISIASDGTVSANFSNGLTQAVFKIPLATFANPDGLAEVSGNAYTSTPDSGSPVVNRETGGCRHHQFEGTRRFDRRSGHRVHQSDHDAARLFGVFAHRDHGFEMLDELLQIALTKNFRRLYQ
jgi:flagellar hook-basal body protein